MPNGNEMINKLRFDELIEGKTDRELSEFSAKQVYELCRKVEGYLRRIESLEAIDKKTFGIAGGIGGATATILGGVILTVLKKLGIDVV